MNMMLSTCLRPILGLAPNIHRDASGISSSGGFGVLSFRVALCALCDLVIRESSTKFLQRCTRDRCLRLFFEIHGIRLGTVSSLFHQQQPFSLVITTCGDWM